MKTRLSLKEAPAETTMVLLLGGCETSIGSQKLGCHSWIDLTCLQGQVYSGHFEMLAGRTPGRPETDH
jgi:hypothetical protein